MASVYMSIDRRIVYKLLLPSNRTMWPLKSVKKDLQNVMTWKGKKLPKLGILWSHLLKANEHNPSVHQQMNG